MGLNDFQKIFLSIILGGVMFVLFTAMVILLTGCSQVNEYLGLEDDNIYEEVIEGAIKFQTGINVDLTPDSKE